MTQVVFCSGTWWGDCALYDSIISVLLCHLMWWLCFICLTYCSVVVPDGVTASLIQLFFLTCMWWTNPFFKQKINLKSKWMWSTNLVLKFVCNLVPSAFSRRKGKSPGSDILFQAMRLCGRRREGMSRKKQPLFLLFSPALSLCTAFRYLNFGASNKLLCCSRPHRRT